MNLSDETPFDPAELIDHYKRIQDAINNEQYALAIELEEELDAWFQEHEENEVDNEE